MQVVEPLTPDRIPSAADLLTAAFSSNPAHVYVLPAPETRDVRLRWLLAANLRVHLDRSSSFCITEGPIVRAMGFWTRSTDPKPGLVRMVSAGLLAAPGRIGLAAVRRSFEVSRSIERDLDRALGGRPFWYLNNMAVDATLRGQGLGSRLLAQQLDAVLEREPSHAVALSTQRPGNVSFYRRLGFVSVRESIVGHGSAAFRSWTMLYAPAASRSRGRGRPISPSTTGSAATRPRGVLRSW